MYSNFDIIVVGGGHAGCEAALAAARLGSKILIVTLDLNKFGQMSCNPAMGGIAKGQIVREIDALGGQSGIITDLSSLQFRMLNKSKGPAMWSPRAQCDKQLFSSLWRTALESHPNISFLQDSVEQLIVKKNKVTGIITSNNLSIFSNSVVLTCGTFLNGTIHIGRSQQFGGRLSEPNVIGLTSSLVKFGFKIKRFKTGTPPRVDCRSINLSKLKKQDGDENPSKFSFLPSISPVEKQLACYITQTNNLVHEILTDGFSESPLLDGTITGIGPRYCPSIETKIINFSGKDHHILFLEPEGRNSYEYYLNGFSSSLPVNVQIKAITEINGFENIHILKPAYAIEYDYFAPSELKLTLESKIIDNLFFAGQINGTTGYEEAAAQGLVAGINAHNKVKGLDYFILKRDQAYIGILIDDLITKPITEPYRMFTSRAEFRLLLRQDSADYRLTEVGYKLGLADKIRYKSFVSKYKALYKIGAFLKKHIVSPEFFSSNNGDTGSFKKERFRSEKLLQRPEVSIFDFLKQNSAFRKYLLINSSIGYSIFEISDLLTIDITIKYSDYFLKELKIVQKINSYLGFQINSKFDYSVINSITLEAKEKLTKIKPKTIGDAMNIDGVSFADIQTLLLYLNK